MMPLSKAEVGNPWTNTGSSAGPSHEKYVINKTTDLDSRLNYAGLHGLYALSVLSVLYSLYFKHSTLL